MKIPNRGDKQYIDIDKFKKYELTYCITYEMAIRNNNVIKLIKNFLDKYSKLNNLTVKEYIAFLEKNNYMEDFEYFFISPFALYLNYYWFDDIDKSNLLKRNFSIVFNPDEIKSNKNNIKLYSMEELEQYILAENIINNLFYYDLHTSLKETIENRIIPNYSRPLSIPKHITREKDIYLNLSLPTDELVDFIQRLKRSSKFKNISKSIYHFFDFENETDTKLIPKTTNKYADMFFCYDCYKLGLSVGEIRKKISKYRYDTNHDSIIDYKTIKLYIDKLKISIDNEEYKYFVT